MTVVNMMQPLVLMTIKNVANQLTVLSSLSSVKIHHKIFFKLHDNLSRLCPFVFQLTSHRYIIQLRGTRGIWLN